MFESMLFNVCVTLTPYPGCSQMQVPAGLSITLPGKEVKPTYQKKIAERDFLVEVATHPPSQIHYDKGYALKGNLKTEGPAHAFGDLIQSLNSYYFA